VTLLLSAKLVAPRVGILLALAFLVGAAAVLLLLDRLLGGHGPTLEPTWHRMSLSPDTGNVNPPDPYLSSILWGRWA
jgi:hypothetical protein